MKKYSKLVLAAGTGHIGTVLKNHFKPLADEIIILTRNPKPQEENVIYIQWDGKNLDTWWVYLDGADVLINLTGKNVNCRYNEKNKKEIFNSRTNSVEVLAAALHQLKVLPKLWIQCASSTIYRHAEDRPMTEENGEIGEGFSVEVCKKWEKTFLDVTRSFPDMRKVILRTSLVLGSEEGVYPRLKNLVRFGLGGPQGNGSQMMSWIHEDDVAGMVEWICDNEEISGIINCTAPEPVRNDFFMKEIRKSLGARFGLPAYRWLLELGAIIIRTETELVLKSRWVLPEKILKSGYRFKFADIKSTFLNLSLSL